MCKALELTDALKAAEEKMKSLLHPVEVKWYEGRWQAQVSFYRDLEQIPGKPEFTEVADGYHAAKAVKTLQGVEFACYLVAEEYQAVKGRKTA